MTAPPPKPDEKSPPRRFRLPRSAALAASACLAFRDLRRGADPRAAGASHEGRLLDRRHVGHVGGADHYLRGAGNGTAQDVSCTTVHQFLWGSQSWLWG